MTARFT